MIGEFVVVICKYSSAFNTSGPLSLINDKLNDTPKYTARLFLHKLNKLFVTLHWKKGNNLLQSEIPL